jgi:hypothetical protein
MEDIDYEKVKEEIARTEKREISKIAIRESFIIFFGILSLFGFIVSISFLIQLNNFNNLTGNVIGSGEGNVYALIIFSVICFVLTIEMLLWYIREKETGGI